MLPRTESGVFKPEGKGKFMALLIASFVFKRCHSLLLRGWLDIPEIENKYSVFPWFLWGAFPFTSLNCLYLDTQVVFSALLPPSCPAEEGEGWSSLVGTWHSARISHHPALRDTHFVTVIHGLKPSSICALRNFQPRRKVRLNSCILFAA